MYYRRPQRKRIYNYFLPFLIIAAIFAGVFYGWNYLNSKFIENDRSTINEKVFLNIESGSAKAMTVGKSEWQNAPDKIYLYRGEGLKTGSDGRVTLTFFDQNIMRLNTDTEVLFASLKKNNDSSNISVKLNKGDIWANVDQIINPNSSFSVSSDLLTLDTRGSVFSFTYPGTVYVLEGSVQVGVKKNDDVIKSYTVGVGQQFMMDESGVESIVRGDSIESLFAMSDSFKESEWYRWNIRKDGEINAFETSGNENTAADETGTSMEETPSAEASSSDTSASSSSDVANMDRLAYVTKPGKDAETNKSTINIEGSYDKEKITAIYIGEKKALLSDGKWSSSVTLLSEGKNDIKIEAEDSTGNRTPLDPLTVVYDKTPPSEPVITDPKPDSVNSDVSTIEKPEQIITGTVDKDVQAVVINDYRLSKYIPGSGTFQYYAKTSYGNLQAGDNEFRIYAEDKAGNKSDKIVIVLKLSQDVIDNAPAETSGGAVGTSTTVVNKLPQASSTGGVKITSPNNGESFTTSETEFEIAGTVPSNTAKVVVNDYPLSLFQSGDTTFKYRAYASIGNLKIGEKNEYIVTAYDSNDSKLGSASIIIDVQSGGSAAPVITIPSSSGSYTTSLDTIVIGGTVGKWVTHMYVNDKEITDYIPGSEKWRASVKLNPGENTFIVNGEKDGESVGKTDIKVTYQQ